MESPPFDLQAYQPPLSLWNLVQQLASSHEKNELKSMLGESLVEQSLELHVEVNTLLEIWQDYRDETNRKSPVQKLPEPPGLRDRLIQEINFFVGNICEKAEFEGLDPEKMLSRHNTEVLDYAVSRSCTASGYTHRNTARSIDGSETPMAYTPTGSDRTSEASMLSEEVESMNDKLNVMKFDEVVLHLRSCLTEEIGTLMADIHFLQQCLDEEAMYRAEVDGTILTEPTITDLREERTMLTKDLLSQELKIESTPAARTTIPAIVKKLTHALPVDTRIKHTDQIQSKIKDSPLKAQHNIKLKPQPPSYKNSQAEITESVDQQKLKTTIVSNIGTKHAHPQVVSMCYTKPPVSEISVCNSGVISGVFRNTNISLADGDCHGSNDTSTIRTFHQTRQTSSESIPVNEQYNSKGVIIPVPPGVSKPKLLRPNSAEKFRKMVVNCRDCS